MIKGHFIVSGILAMKIKNFYKVELIYILPIFTIIDLNARQRPTTWISYYNVIQGITVKEMICFIIKVPWLQPNRALEQKALSLYATTIVMKSNCMKSELVWISDTHLLLGFQTVQFSDTFF